MEQKKYVVTEWVLTNGKLPAFIDRVRRSFPYWDVVGPSGMTVYRAHGSSIANHSNTTLPPPHSIVAGIRPVIATSKTLESVMRYAGAGCCIFKITLAPGTRYIDVNRLLTFYNQQGERALAVKNVILDNIREMCPSQGTWPTDKTSLYAMRQAILDRCLGRVKYKGEPREEIVPPENEIMVYGLNGVFSEPVQIEPIEGKTAYTTTFSPTAGGSRGRTFRRKAKRMNKNGGRPSRKSKHSLRRNRHA